MSITAANAVLTLSVGTIIPNPSQLQGFAADDIYDIPRIKSVETRMGVDGVLSGGFVFVEIPQTITLQADSASNSLFDVWWTQMQAAQETFTATGAITLTGVSTKFKQTKGFLTGYVPIPPGKRVLEPRTYEITWESVAPSPM